MRMNREAAKEYAKKTLIYQELDRWGIRPGKALFSCINPEHGDKHPSMGFDSKSCRCHCFSCGAGYDIFDMVGLRLGIDDPGEKMSRTYEEYGIEIENDDGSIYQPSTGSKPKSNGYDQLQRKAAPATQSEQKPETDYSSFFQEAHKHINETNYHRGLSPETLERFNIGYVAAWREPLEVYLQSGDGLTSTGKPRTKESWNYIPESERLIIPTSKYSYIARYAGTDHSGKFNPEKSKMGKVRIFNAAALWKSEKPVFIVEGEIDALSVIDVGGEAIGLGSTSQKNRLLSMLEKRKPEVTLLLALDNDPEKDGKQGAGQKTTAELSEKLTEMGVRFMVADITGGHKDANEFLMADRDGFRKAVVEAENEAVKESERELEAEREKLLRESAAHSIQGFMNRIAASKRQSFIPTGFKNLDRLVLDGGLFPGLYIVGAISSLGKTTFCLQLGDQIAAQGHDVLFFSLEMATDELIAKSVSRCTLIRDLHENATTTHAKSTRGVLTGSRYDDYNQEDLLIIQSAIQDYAQIAEHIFITEGVGDIGITQIREKIMNHIRITGKAPVVIIDYLQIIAPADIRATDKQNTDKAVLELKRMSRDYGIPIIGISSFNRESYTDPVSMKCFKESGAIEYSSDILIGLQYKGMDYKKKEKLDDSGNRYYVRENDKDREARIQQLIEDQAEKGKKGEAQSVQIKVLKNRNGNKGTSAIDFYPMFNFFTEPDEKPDDGSSTTGNAKSSRKGYKTRRDE